MWGGIVFHTLPLCRVVTPSVMWFESTPPGWICLRIVRRLAPSVVPNSTDSASSRRDKVAGFCAVRRGGYRVVLGITRKRKFLSPSPQVENVVRAHRIVDPVSDDCAGACERHHTHLASLKEVVGVEIGQVRKGEGASVGAETTDKEALILGVSKSDFTADKKICHDKPVSRLPVCQPGDVVRVGSWEMTGFHWGLFAQIFL